MFESSLLARVPVSALPCEGTNMTYRVPCSEVGLLISSVWGRVDETRGHGVALALAHHKQVSGLCGKPLVILQRAPMSSPGPTFFLPSVTVAFLGPRQTAQAPSLLSFC